MTLTPPDLTGRGRAGRWLRGVVIAALLGLALAAFIALLGPLWWGFDLLASFAPYYAVAAAAGLVLTLALGWRRWALLAAVVLVAHAPALLYLVREDGARATIGGQTTPLRLTTMNVNWANEDTAAILAFVRRARPDVLIVQEPAYTTWRGARIESLGALFPYAAPKYWRYGGAILVFSRFPIRNEKDHVVIGRGKRVTFLTMDIVLGKTTVGVVAVHTAKAVNAAGYGEQMRAMRKIAAYARRRRGPLIVAGDFNLTPFSNRFSALLAVTRLRDAARGRGWRPTWTPFWRLGMAPLARALPWLGLPIDHVLLSPGIAVAALRQGPYIGSDHYPLTVELRVSSP